jgi:peptide/nickel transport system permease protein
MIIVAVFAPFFAPYDPEAGTLYEQFIPLSWMEGGDSAHFLGTDYFGRDILTRLIYGARVSLSIAAVCVVIAGGVGTAVGLISGYFGGWVDIVIMRVVDSVLSFPVILIAILLAVTLGPSYQNIILIIALFAWPRYARQIRGEVLSIREQEYVALAKVAGCSPWRMMWKHIFPNTVPTLLVLTTFQIGHVIMYESFLSFLGVGIPPPTPTWGAMTSEGRDYIGTYWWLSALPGLAILITILSSNLLGDWIRDRLDPRLRQV